MFNKGMALLISAGLMISMAGCGQSTDSAARSSESIESQIAIQSETDSTETEMMVTEVSTETATETEGNPETDLFSERDLTQTADLSEAETLTIEDNQTIDITKEGVYVVSGSAENVTINVDAGDEDKVQIVLDGAQIVNDSQPVIYVKNADKVFVTTTSSSENALSVTGTFTADGETNTDAVIFSRDDLVINGLGSLTISSTDNGISSKDDLKITGGSLQIDCASDALEAHESIVIADGHIVINTSEDGLHAENDEDNTTGYIYIGGGTLDIHAGDDGIHATTSVQIDDGEISVEAEEGIEGTFIQINGGTISITAGDDGINAANKSTACSTALEINGGDLTIDMGQGDTDAIDSNGDLTVTGGSIKINAQSPFDADGNITYTGGTIIVNGTQIDEITNQMMGGPGAQNGFGGFGSQGGQGGMGGFGGPQGHGGF